MKTKQENNDKLEIILSLRFSKCLYNDIQRLAKQGRRNFADYVRIVLEDAVNFNVNNLTKTKRAPKCEKKSSIRL